MVTGQAKEPVQQQQALARPELQGLQQQGQARPELQGLQQQELARPELQELQQQELAQKPVHSMATCLLSPVPTLVLSQMQEQQLKPSFYPLKQAKSGWKS